MLASFNRALKYVAQARRFEQLFDMTESELAARGLDRDALVRSYISGLGHS